MLMRQPATAKTELIASGDTLDRDGVDTMRVRICQVSSLLVALALCIAVSTPTIAATSKVAPPVGDRATNAVKPELGQQMLELQIRHNRLWWAAKAGNWNLAYYMVSEIGEALRAIEKTNGDTPELQPQKLSELMPAIMNPAVRAVQQSLEQRNQAAFGRAYDKLSGACNACHAEAGVEFLHLQRPKTPMLDNLRYAPLKGK
jgi:hypothetical protein